MISIRATRGDITEFEGDAIVNAANSHLAGGGGVDGAIHRAGGPSIMEETRRLYPDGCPTGSAVISGAGDLPVRHVIHAVGPIWRDGRVGEPELLASAYRTCLALAASQGLESVAFPSISTGAYGYPMHEAAQIALETVRTLLETDAGTIRLVRFVLFDQHTLRGYISAANKVWQT